jgi:hypothetical protein
VSKSNRSGVGNQLFSFDKFSIFFYFFLMTSTKSPWIVTSNLGYVLMCFPSDVTLVFGICVHVKSLCRL